jgi:hypothetical protein
MNLAWTREKAIEAQEQGYFIYVPSGKKIYLSDAVAMWNDDETVNVMFHTGYRIAGDIFDINTALRANSISEQIIGNIIQTSINSENYSGDLAQLYQTTLAEDQIKRIQPRITRPVTQPVIRPSIQLTRPIIQQTQPIQPIQSTTIKDSRLQWSNIEIAKLTHKMQLYGSLLDHLSISEPYENFELRNAAGEIRRELQADRDNCERTIRSIRDEIQLMKL